jgi:hypothetical protein
MTLASDRPAIRILRTRIVAALASLFNFLVLNLALLIVSLPLVTLPIAVNAAMTALNRWRSDGEDRVLREFFNALRSSPPFHTTFLVGVPLGMVGLGVEEVHYFARTPGFGPRVCFGLGLSALIVTLTSLGYVLALVALRPSAPAGETWSVCVRLGIRNLLVTGPLFLIEMVGVTVATAIDPALLIFGAPLALLQLMRLTAQVGLRKAKRKLWL